MAAMAQGKVLESERSAQRYMKAFEFAKSVTVADFSECKLTPGALYLLSEDRYWSAESGNVDDRRIATTAVLKEASERWVDEDRAREIIENILDDIDAAQRAPEDEGSLTPEPTPEPFGPALVPDEPPPAPPPPTPAPLPRDRYLTETFVTAVREIRTLMTKPSAKFVGVVQSEELEMIANFLKQIAARAKEAHLDCP